VSVEPRAERREKENIEKERIAETDNLPAGAKIGEVKIVLTKVDVSNPEQVEEWVQSTVKDFGRLDGAANVAGMAGGDGDTTCATIVSYSILWVSGFFLVVGTESDS
jgi:NAD(P)-dependent dehydrogenase (short-subunit alcohol dehydrogenase family)